MGERILLFIREITFDFLHVKKQKSYCRGENDCQKCENWDGFLVIFSEYESASLEKVGGQFTSAVRRLTHIGRVPISVLLATAMYNVTYALQGRGEEGEAGGWV